MDLGNSTVKTPEPESETPTRIQPTKPSAFTNGVLKRHAPLHHHHLSLSHHHHPVVVTYKECLKNHAASLGGHAVDGCGEFMPSRASNPAEPTSLKCAACGCHRNFHRRDPESPTSAAIMPPFLDFRHPPLPKRFSLSPSPPSSSPPPPAVAALPFFGLSVAEEHQPAPVTPTVENQMGRKRFRTKFSQDQKEKMLSFAVKLGWKMQKSDEAAVKEFCHGIGVTKGVLKVWMHNNKNTFARKETSSGGGGNTNDSLTSYENSGGSGSGSGSGGGRKLSDSNGNLFVSENGNGAHFHGCSSPSPA